MNHNHGRKTAGFATALGVVAMLAMLLAPNASAASFWWMDGPYAYSENVGGDGLPGPKTLVTLDAIPINPQQQGGVIVADGVREINRMSTYGGASYEGWDYAYLKNTGPIAITTTENYHLAVMVTFKGSAQVSVMGNAAALLDFQFGYTIYVNGEYSGSYGEELWGAYLTSGMVSQSWKADQRIIGDTFAFQAGDVVEVEFYMMSLGGVYSNGGMAQINGDMTAMVDFMSLGMEEGHD